MVEYTSNLDSVFGSLADPTRRDILRRVAARELSVNEIAQPYNLTLAAISKHIKILERARLIRKSRRGRCHYVKASPAAFKEAAEYLERYKALWDERYDALEQIVRESKEEER